MNERILIAEDHPLHMKLMEMALRDKNYTLLKATDGEAALDVATSQRPDLILMDIRLPKMDGLQVTKKLRENPAFSDTPIIALTAHAMAGDRESVIKSGCDAYLSKPIDTHELLEMIAETLLKRRQKSLNPNDEDND